MKYYFGLGGLGCRALRQFAAEAGLEKRQCFYLDCDADAFWANPFAPDDRCYVMERTSAYTSGRRAVGRAMFKYELYSGRLGDFLNAGKLPRAEKLVFVTSSFGGFGGAVLGELIDYIEALLWTKLPHDGGSCEVIAFNEGGMAAGGFPRMLLDLFEMNTYEFIGELREKCAEAPRQKDLLSGMDIFYPFCSLYLVDTSHCAPEEYPRFLRMPAEELAALDISRRYEVRHKRNSAEVFISYSSKNEDIVRRIDKKLSERQIGCWAAYKSITLGSYGGQIVKGIKEAKIFLVILSRDAVRSEHVKSEVDRAFSRLSAGMKIIPFIIDDAELDDELSYYLCRQEKILANTPPLARRIDDLVEQICALLD